MNDLSTALQVQHKQSELEIKKVKPNLVCYGLVERGFAPTSKQGRDGDDQSSRSGSQLFFLRYQRRARLHLQARLNPLLLVLRDCWCACIK